MFTLLRGLWKYFFRKDEYYIVILGLDNAGKTVKLNYYVAKIVLILGVHVHVDFFGKDEEHVYQQLHWNATGEDY